MKKLYILGMLTLSFSHLKADYWTQKADFPGHKRTIPISFSMGDYGYVGWGTDTTNMSVKDLWAYNANTNVWTQKASLPGGNNARSGSACFINTITGKAYAGLGQNTIGTLYQDWWEYNTATNVWSAKANFPGGTRTLATAFFANGYGYVGMGSGIAGDFNDLWLYEPISNSWQSKAPLPSIYGRREVASFAVGTSGYVATGYSTLAGSSLFDLYQYDAPNNNWIPLSSFSGDARFGASAFVLYNHGFVGLGNTIIGNYATDFWVYDLFTDTWYQKANFGGVGRFEAAAFAIHDSGYFGCGGAPGFFYRDLWKYTPDTVTGINEGTNHNVQFTIYPNPVSQYAVISMQSPENKKINIIITDIQGKKVYSEQFQPSILRLQTTIDVSNFSNGIYFICVENGKQKATKKFLKE